MDIDLLNALLELSKTSLSLDERIRELSQTVINDFDLLHSFLKEAIESNDGDAIDAALELYWLSPHKAKCEHEFNQLLVSGNHFHHQKMLSHLQNELRYTSSIKSLRILLDLIDTDFFSYSGSDDYVIAQWISWALVGIGSREALNVIDEYTHSPVKGIKDQMTYRLAKISLHEAERTIRENKSFVERSKIPTPKSSILNRFRNFFK